LLSLNLYKKEDTIDIDQNKQKYHTQNGQVNVCCLRTQKFFLSVTQDTASIWRIDSNPGRQIIPQELVCNLEIVGRKINSVQIFLPCD